ncbi:MAG: BPL-N domain-containing protein [Desulfohalobiaceae bacterium]
MDCSQYQNSAATNICLLWDESHLWGIMLLRSLQDMGLPFYIVRSSQVRRRALQSLKPKILLLPGGWASSKARSLGRQGRESIRDYVRAGGHYLGLCGGAGLALQDQEPSLGLCSWSRKPMPQRLPNCSGHMHLNPEKGTWFQELLGEAPLLAPVWWPSQFSPSLYSQGAEILARYHEPGQDFWVADLPLQALDQELLQNWQELYSINLDPGLLKREPAIIQGKLGKGSYLLSYVHLETPCSPQANQCLLQILKAFCQDLPQSAQALTNSWDLRQFPISWPQSELEKAWKQCLQLVQLGQENFLLCWRKPWLLGWRRGVPGFALNTVMAQLTQLLQLPAGRLSQKFWDNRRNELQSLLQGFHSLYTSLLLQERLQLTTQSAAPQPGGSNKLKQQRELLTGSFPGQGGIFGRLTWLLQELLWQQLLDNQNS